MQPSSQIKALWQNTYISSPRKISLFKWDEAAQHNYNLLKSALLKDPILIHPDYSKDFYLITDASDDTIGSILAHKIGGIFRPISYYSSKMKDAETRYTVPEKEGLAIIHSNTLDTS